MNVYDSEAAELRLHEESRPGFLSNPLAQRILVLALVLGSEALLASGARFPHPTFPNEGGAVTGLLRDWGVPVAAATVSFAALFAIFAYLKYQTPLADIASQLAQAPVHRTYTTAHFAAIGVFGVLSVILHSGNFAVLSPDLVALTWLAAGAAAAAFAGLALVPGHLWVKVVRSTGKLWILASSAAIALYLAAVISETLWEPAARLTFSLVKLLLTPLVQDMVVRPASMIIGTHRFTALIAPGCSGLTGVGFLLVFGAMYLTLFREQIRFPQTLLLLTAGIAVQFLLNAIRIVALILIGHAGAREIAAGGFHEQAGWMVFVCVAFAFSIVVQRLPWFSVRPHVPESFAETAENPTSAYVIPFLAILVAGMISRAASGSFEWLYGLRFVAALGALWLFRKTYLEFDWKLTWLGPVSGVGVFLLWVALDRITAVHGGVQSVGTMPGELANSSTGLRTAWIAVRVLAAVVTVPLAEELAFRGFLLRRLISSHFESVSLQKFTWVSLLASSLLFGALHGDRWLAGTAAGVLYGLTAQRRGRLADSVFAHATTNALLAAYVLTFQKWHFW